MEYALKALAEGSFEETTEAVESAVEANGFFVVGAHDVHVTLAHKGFRIHPVRIYEVRRVPVSDGTAAPSPAMRDVLPGRISVFMEGDDVVVAAVRPGVIMALYPEAGLALEARDLERSLTAIVRDAVTDAIGESERVR